MNAVESAARFRYCETCRTISRGVYCGGCGKAMGERRVIGGRYLLEGEPLDSGSMGSVYVALQPSVNKRVALKLLHPHLTADREMVKRFLDEARKAGAINHVGVIQVFDAERTAEDDVYIAMELLSGGSLTRVLASEGPQPPERAIELWRQVVSAMASAHKAGVVHRDLKPDNIFVTPVQEEDGPRDRVKVLDFGIAKLQEAHLARRTQEGSFLGTPWYAAPEQFDAAAVDARADVYALGLILYEMLSGVLPWTGDRNVMLGALKRIQVPPRPLPSVCPLWHFPPGFLQLMASMLELSPALRPATAIEVQSELRKLLGNSPLPWPRSEGAAENSLLEPVPVPVPKPPSSGSIPPEPTRTEIRVVGASGDGAVDGFLGEGEDPPTQVTHQPPLIKPVVAVSAPVSAPAPVIAVTGVPTPAPAPAPVIPTAAVTPPSSAPAGMTNHPDQPSSGSETQVFLAPRPAPMLASSGGQPTTEMPGRGRLARGGMSSAGTPEPRTGAPRQRRLLLGLGAGASAIGVLAAFLMLRPAPPPPSAKRVLPGHVPGPDPKVPPASSTEQTAQTPRPPGSEGPKPPGPGNEEPGKEASHPQGGSTGTTRGPVPPPPVPQVRVVKFRVISPREKPVWVTCNNSRPVSCLAPCSLKVQQGSDCRAKVDGKGYDWCDLDYKTMQREMSRSKEVAITVPELRPQNRRQQRCLGG